MQPTINSNEFNKGRNVTEENQNKKSPILETSSDAIDQALKLMRLARHGAVSVLEPETGYPFVSRTNCVMTMQGEPVFLMSDLSAHTKAIKNDARTALLLGEPGKGDPLAHPRITIIGQTERIDKDENPELETHLRTRYINRHPKAELYNALPDFFIYKMTVERASMNAGFGKAYELTREELLLDETAANELATVENRIVGHMNEDHADAIQHYAVNLCGKEPGKWTISACDPEGIDMIAGDQTARLLFDTLCASATEVRHELVRLAQTKD